MCFSPTASFVTAALTGVIGLATVSRVNQPREALLAATPLLFAAQQAIEGLLWLKLPMESQGSAESGLTLAFLVFAQVVWPSYAPTAVLLIEPVAARRRVMLALLALGLGVSTYLLINLFSHPHGAKIIDDHIVYVSEQHHSVLIACAYLIATSLPLLLSSRRTVQVLGSIVLVGSAIAYAFYWHAFQSVWCYFAAAGSVVLLAHFHLLKRPRLHHAIGY